MTPNNRVARIQMITTSYIGLYAQGLPAMDQVGGCKYRLDLGGVVLKCGIGHLIPDSLYDSEIENKSVITLYHERYKLPKSFNRTNQKFLLGLQSIHDNFKGHNHLPFKPQEFRRYLTSHYNKFGSPYGMRFKGGMVL